MSNENMAPFRERRVIAPARSVVDDDGRRTESAAVYRRGSEKPSDRLVIHGSFEEMIKWFMSAEPGRRRNFTIIKDSMEYQPAEVENLARQFGISKDGDGGGP